MTWRGPLNPGESRAQLYLTPQDEAELNERIRTSLGYMDAPRIAQYLGVSLFRVEEVRRKTPYFRVKGLRDVVKSGVRRG